MIRLGTPAARTVVVGAGIAGVAVADALAARGDGDVLLVDERAPLTLTSAMSTECYRDWWPGPDPAMALLVGRSIDLLERLSAATAGAFHMNRRGYLYATADPARAGRWEREARELAAHGGGPLRVHRGSPDDPTYVPSPSRGIDPALRGFDLITDRAVIARHFPYLSSAAVAVLHARRCGWLSAQQLGTVLLERARAGGARVLRGRADAIEAGRGRVQRVHVGGEAVACERLVIAAGPGTRNVARMLGVELPIDLEPHLKVAFRDTLGAVPRDAPFLVWSDPQRLPWDDAERAELRVAGLGELADGTLWHGPHGRPEGGGDSVVMLWSYGDAAGPVSCDRPDPRTSEIVLRGWSAMLPALRPYFARLPRPRIDGGYYARTPENRPLIGPLPVEGAYVVGALSGFGIMAACGAADLAARHILGEELPPYAEAFLFGRYADPAYRARLPEMVTGQL